VRASVARLSDLAGDLDGVKELEASDLAVAPAPVDLADQLCRAVETMPDAEGVEVRAPRGVAVHADEEGLAVVMRALVSNALHHGAPPVVVDAHRGEAGTVEIVVCDHGPGVPPAEEPRLFAYRRRSSDPSAKGLSQVRALVEAMGGRVGYEPVVGGGACFRIVLPTPKVH
jgi:two-component system sensor histidine kinase MtrB